MKNPKLERSDRLRRIRSAAVIAEQWRSPRTAFLSTPIRAHRRLCVSRILSTFVALYMSTAMSTALGCGEGSSSSSDSSVAAIAATQSRDVDFDRAAITIVDDSLSFYPATFQVFSIVSTPFGQNAGVTAQASLGCFS